MVRAMTTWSERFPRTLSRLERDFEILMGEFFGRDENRGLGWLTSVPLANVTESAASIEVTVELPGMKPEEFTVELKNGELWISGERKTETEEKGKIFHRLERSYGEFRRMIPLPTAVEPGKIEAEYKDGVLRITIPKTPEAKPRHIAVKSA
jgi:HSP20 family protein